MLPTFIKVGLFNLKTQDKGQSFSIHDITASPDGLGLGLHFAFRTQGLFVAQIQQDAGPKDLVHIYHTADLSAMHARWKSAVLFLTQGVIVLGSLTLGLCIFCQFLIPSGFDHDP